MTKLKLANYISDGLNPLVLGLVILANVAFTAAADAAQAFGWFLLVTGLVFLPVLLIAMFFVRTGRMDALFSNRRHQRHRIYVIGLFFAVLTMLVLNWLNAPVEIVATLVTGIVTVVTFAAVNLWWKISVHTSTVSALAVILLVLYGWWAVPSLVLVPMMGWSRIVLAQHTLGQVVAGALVSAIIVIAVFFQYGVI
ncbi:phosphatidic acid phosphatase [Dehalogenimonas sp. THU2]|uniref:phosphatidic acid phosphatase n=1 Tax=Dehalogenimonas sp. THU2 TaxID=3151121 RepID=UPI003218DE4B